MTDKAYAVPLHELLARVPRDARLVIDDPDGMGTQYIPVGSYCHEAAEALRARLAQPEQEPVSKAWDEGYRQGVQDERTSEANIGIAGFNAKVEPARQNPYGAAPPQRKWLWLTDEEIEQCAIDDGSDDLIFARAIETKSKEKNT